MQMAMINYQEKRKRTDNYLLPRSVSPLENKNILYETLHQTGLTGWKIWLAYKFTVILLSGILVFAKYYFSI